MKHLSRDKHTTNLDPRQPPALRVSSGEEVMVESWDAFMGNWTSDEQDRVAGAASGPIFVEGAQRGDALRVDILSIDVADAAVHKVRPGTGFLPERFDTHYPTIMNIKDNRLELPGGVTVPIRPSVGMIAVSPGRSQSTASDSGPYGGDLDVKEMVAGSVVWLPVFVEGALLVLGDMHAAVGDGAVGGTGAEVSAQTHIRVTVEKGRKLRYPRVLTPDYFITISSARRASVAMKQAVQEMVDFLSEEKGMAPYDAYSLLSLAGDVRISRTFRPISPCKMLLSREVVDQLG